jgi:hypothetical protein
VFLGCTVETELAGILDNGGLLLATCIASWHRSGVFTFWAQQGEVVFAFDADSEAILRVFDTNWAAVEHDSRTDNTLFDIYIFFFTFYCDLDTAKSRQCNSISANIACF